RIHGVAIIRRLTIVIRRRDKGWGQPWCWNTVVEVEVWIGLVRHRILTGTEVLREIVAVERHASVPSGIKSLCKENTIAGSDHGLLVHGIGKAEPRCEAVLPRFFGIVAAEAGTSASRTAPRKRKCPGNSGGRVDAVRIEK